MVNAGALDVTSFSFVMGIVNASCASYVSCLIVSSG